MNSKLENTRLIKEFDYLENLGEEGNKKDYEIGRGDTLPFNGKRRLPTDFSDDYCVKKEQPSNAYMPTGRKYQNVTITLNHVGFTLEKQYPNRVETLTEMEITSIHSEKDVNFFHSRFLSSPGFINDFLAVRTVATLVIPELGSDYLKVVKCIQETFRADGGKIGVYKHRSSPDELLVLVEKSLTYFGKFLEAPFALLQFKEAELFGLDYPFTIQEIVIRSSVYVKEYWQITKGLSAEINWNIILKEFSRGGASFQPTTKKEDKSAVYLPETKGISADKKESCYCYGNQRRKVETPSFLLDFQENNSETYSVYAKRDDFKNTHFDKSSSLIKEINNLKEENSQLKTEIDSLKTKLDQISKNASQQNQEVEKKEREFNLRFEELTKEKNLALQEQRKSLMYQIRFLEESILAMKKSETALKSDLDAVTKELNGLKETKIPTNKISNNPHHQKEEIDCLPLDIDGMLITPLKSGFMNDQQTQTTSESVMCNNCGEDMRCIIHFPCNHMLYCRSCWANKTKKAKQKVASCDCCYQPIKKSIEALYGFI